MILYNALGYLQEIYERTRYLSDAQKPRQIIIEEAADHAKPSIHAYRAQKVGENAKIHQMRNDPTAINQKDV